MALQCLTELTPLRHTWDQYSGFSIPVFHENDIVDVAHRLRQNLAPLCLVYDRHNHRDVAIYNQRDLIEIADQISQHSHLYEDDRMQDAAAASVKRECVTPLSDPLDDDDFALNDDDDEPTAIEGTPHPASLESTPDPESLEFTPDPGSPSTFQPESESLHHRSSALTKPRYTKSKSAGRTTKSAGSQGRKCRKISKSSRVSKAKNRLRTGERYYEKAGGILTHHMTTAEWEQLFQLLSEWAVQPPEIYRTAKEERNQREKVLIKANFGVVLSTRQLQVIQRDAEDSGFQFEKSRRGQAMAELNRNRELASQAWTLVSEGLSESDAFAKVGISKAGAKKYIR